MAAKCPHCSGEVENLDGFVSQELHVQRLNAKTDANKSALDAKAAEISLLKDSLREYGDKAKNYDSVLKERDTLKAQVTEVTERAERTTALAQIGVTDPKVVRAFEALYQSEMAGREDGAKVKFGEFDGWAKEHPLLTPVFAVKEQAPATGQKAPETPQAPAPKLPNANNNAASPPSTEPRMKPGELVDYFSSREYTSLPKEQREAKRVELQAKYGG